MIFLSSFSFVFTSESYIYFPNKKNNEIVTKQQKIEDFWKKTKEIPINFTPKQIAKTRTGNLYVSDKKGNVFFFDMQNLDKMQSQNVIYTPEKIAQISQIDAWQTQEIMLFYMDYQEFHLLDRFLKPIAKRELPKQFVEYATASTPASDGNIWVWDSASNSLKKINPAQEQLFSQTNLATILPQLEEININFMREYQYQVFLTFLEEKNELKKIFIFDLFGNYKKIIDLNVLFPDIKYFTNLDFWDNEFYTFFENKLYFIDIYTQKYRIISLPNENNVLFWTKIEEILLEDKTKKIETKKIETKKIEKWIGFTANKMLVYELNKE